MIGYGLLAGAAGTLMLDVVSYLDMTIRGRPASELPGKVIAALAERVGLDDLAHGEDDAMKARRSALGALSGYAVGAGSGVAYALVRRPCAWLPWPIAGLVLGGATLLVSEGSATKLGATDWSTWSIGDWISDIVPRSAYGLTVAYAIEKLLETDDRF